MYCRNCGNLLSKDERFCQKCGQKIITHEESVEPSWEKERRQKKSRIKCINCKYIGEGLRGRSRWASVLSLLCAPLAPIIPIIYFLVTPKWLCSKCKSKFIEEIDEQGKIIKRRNVWLIILIIIVGIAVTGTLASIVLVSLGGAREKARDAVRQSDIRQIAVALELYYLDNEQYIISISGTPIPLTVKYDLSPYLEIPDDPSGPEYGYTWIDNTSGCGYGYENKCFCVYTVLEGEADYPIFAANEIGTAFLEEAPTSARCFESID